MTSSNQTMFVLMLAAVLACATPLNAESQTSSSKQRSDKVYLVPNYQLMVVTYKDAQRNLLLLTPNKNEENDLKHHYGLLEGTLLELRNLTRDDFNNYGLVYDEAVNKGVALGWISPGVVGHLVRVAVNQVASQVDVLVKLVEELCPVQLDYLCNYLVQQEVELHAAKYKVAEPLLRAVYALSLEYLKNTYVKEARRHTMLQMLVSEGKYTLQKLANEVRNVDVILRAH